MNLHLWVTYSGDHTAEKLGATFAGSLPFDIAHAVGNVLFCFAFGPVLIRALRRYRTRFEITWRDTLSDRSASRADSGSPAPSAARQAAAKMAPNGPAPSTDAIGSSAPGDGWASDSIRANPARYGVVERHQHCGDDIVRFEVEAGGERALHPVHHPLLDVGAHERVQPELRSEVVVERPGRGVCCGGQRADVDGLVARAAERVERRAARAVPWRSSTIGIHSGMA